MAVDNAIFNAGEYYSAHYLAEHFHKDIADRIKIWKDQGSQSVPRRIQALADTYFKTKTRALDYPDPETRALADSPELSGWHSRLLEAMDFIPEPQILELETEKCGIPVLLRLNRHNQPWLVIVQTPFCMTQGDYDEEPLELPVSSGLSQDDAPVLQAEWEKAVAILFRQEDRPRWVMLLSGSRIYLFDGHTYSQGRYLYADLDEAFAGKDAKTFQALAALMSRETLAPDSESDEILHERLREGSLKSTHGVSGQLQMAVRKAIELIANGWVEARRANKLGFRYLGENENPLPDGTREINAEQLKHEALVYIYRILFCLYAEAHKDMDILPIKDDYYRLGYSLEALRDLADLREPGTSSENGTYYAEHLAKLFRLIHEGSQAETFQDSILKTKSDKQVAHSYDQVKLFGSSQVQLSIDSSKSETPKIENDNTFIIRPLTANLFDPDSTPLLNRVKISNRVLHQVIRCLSLGTGDKGKQIGRINYAELGIVQLGAVYEGLLSYNGFFAKEELIQVLQIPKNTEGKHFSVYDDKIDPSMPTWFVSKKRLDEFKKGEVVMEQSTKKVRIYKTGEFILHLNGVDRAQTASYYTPAALTRTLVREALKERLKDFKPEQADDILSLKICEPAMGSAAFLVEAIDQLAHHYLVLKQKQTGENIAPGDYEDEHRRVMHFIVVNNVYGVDLNPTAVELGSLSLWLAAIHRLKVKEGKNGQTDISTPASAQTDCIEPAHDIYQTCATPWFGFCLRPGNSLIGARRAVWTREQLLKGKFCGKAAKAPRLLKPGEARKTNEIYHFLVWNEDMAPAGNNQIMKSYWPEECKAFAQWRNNEVKRKWDPEETAAALKICDAADLLWESYAQEREKGLEQTKCTATVWPVSSKSETALKPSMSLKRQEAVKSTLESESGAFQRLKLLMDCWCSFYFWPLKYAEKLPRREAWLAAARILLWGKNDNDADLDILRFKTGDEFDVVALFQEREIKQVDIPKIIKAVHWFETARQVDGQQHFHHWELIFTEILGPGFKGQKQIPNGFDLMFGNPPWRKVTWNDAALLAEFDPMLGVRDAKSAAYNQQRGKLLENEKQRLEYRDEFEKEEGTVVFLNNRVLYPALAGVQTNLYKNFIERSWDLLSEKGVAGLVHEVGVFDDPKGGKFRSEYYKRLLKHYQFKNELLLFADVGNVKPYSLNIYQGIAGGVKFNAIFNLFHPDTIEKCYIHQDIYTPIPEIKDDKGKLEQRGHVLRILKITDKELNLFAKLFEDDNTPYLETRLPWIHSQPLLNVFEKFAKVTKRLGDLKGEYLATVMFDETYSQRDGILTREDNPSFQPKSTDEWVLSGPHFYVSNPFNKTPFTHATTQRAYHDIDLTEIPDDYLPRAVYRPGNRKGDLKAFYNAIPEWPKPSKPGFWPVSDAEIPAYEALLGEPLKLYGLDTDLPGAKTARKFGYFLVWEGAVEAAVEWLIVNGFNHGLKAFYEKNENVILKQKEPDKNESKMMPLPLTARMRLVFRRRGQSANERTLVPSIMPYGVSHIHPVLSLSFIDQEKLMVFSSSCLSLLYDFLIRVTGRGDILESSLRPLSFSNDDYSIWIRSRAIRLFCLTSHYSKFWKDQFADHFKHDIWSQSDERLTNEYEAKWKDLTSVWQRNFALRTDYSRRLAQIEIDALVALSLGLTDEDLIQVYKIQFPVMKTYEEADQYDAKGRRLPNTTRKDAGAKELREALKDHDGKSPITVNWEIDNGNQTVTRTFYPPFTHVDRIDDYKTAYRIFSECLKV
ncbi:SAM-dependent DNA methylase [Desulfonema limicola]|uniref:site-specific DNA-methyltransferase (adenine-specific) n=1 Tax=Desulfonema limicola TaxID=45656 RepID=A0A975GJT3_9BACT|nr:N-6 DNA methylase [Desulfonema limicola]QTA83835.1 SAM-dependent DNA methylase [Desulfonema limicola]